MTTRSIWCRGAMACRRLLTARSSLTAMARAARSMVAVVTFRRAIGRCRSTRRRAGGPCSETRRTLGLRTNALAFLTSSLTQAALPAPTEIAGAIGTKSGNVRFLLHKMMKDGQVTRARKGLYSAPHIPPTNNANTLTGERE